MVTRKYFWVNKKYVFLLAAKQQEWKTGLFDSLVMYR